MEHSILGEIFEECLISFMIGSLMNMRLKKLIIRCHWFLGFKCSCLVRNTPKDISATRLMTEA